MKNIKSVNCREVEISLSNNQIFQTTLSFYLRSGFYFKRIVLKRNMHQVTDTCMELNVSKRICGKNKKSRARFGKSQPVAISGYLGIFKALQI